MTDTPQNDTAPNPNRPAHEDSRTQGAAPDTAASEVASLRAKLEETQKVVEGLRDQLLRKAAEFENFRRRSAEEFSGLVRNANENLLSALLPVLDDFARSLRAGKDLKDFEAFYRGIELIAGKLTRILENEGLTPFESEGKPFDVHYHDALLQVPRTDVPGHTVIEEVEKGYMVNERVLRHAKVIVSAAPDEPAAGDSDQEGQASS
jgi:molecular chaperone GrpE